MKACLVLCEWVNLPRKHNLTQTHIQNHTRQTHKNSKCLKHSNLTPMYYLHFWGLKNWSENFPECPHSFVTPLTLIHRAWLQNQGGFQTKSAGKAHRFEYLALPSAREWLNNTYIVHWVCRTPVMRERKTLWGSYTPRHYLLRSFVSWWFKDTRWETVLESMITRENGQNTCGKAWALHGSYLKPLRFGNYKIPFSRRKLFYRGQCLWPYSL